MKVVEKDSDRKAQVNIYVNGQVGAQKEYGEYIDATDKAMCCYVPLDEGHQPRIGGRFSGTTLAVAYDTIVDGVLRKASSYKAKAVSQQNNKKIDTEKFLYKTKKGIIDTDITVAGIPNVVTTRSDALETIGTIELRLYVTRQLGVSHEIRDMKKYYSVEDEQADNAEEKLNYKLIPQAHKMSFEKNTALLEERQPILHRRRADAKRPGAEPWAIFRFHYRTSEEIAKENMVMTYDPDSKEKTEPRLLLLDPVPPLRLGEKPLKHDEDASSRSSSPMPPGTPSTPAKSVQPAPTVGTTKITSATTQGHTAISKASSLAPKSATNPETQEKLLTTLSTTDTPSEPTADSTAKDFNLPELNTKLASFQSEKPPVATRETVTKPPHSPISPVKKPIIKPALIGNTSTNVQKKQDTPSRSVMPDKRHASATDGVSPNPKRTKVITTPCSPSTQLAIPRTPLRSPTPKIMSIERQLADQRKRLEEMRTKRIETAQKQAVIDEQMLPYKQRMVEELDRLNREMMDEESAYNDEVEQYSASIKVLRDFKKADGGN